MFLLDIVLDLLSNGTPSKGCNSKLPSNATTSERADERDDMANHPEDYHTEEE